MREGGGEGRMRGGRGMNGEREKRESNVGGGTIAWGSDRGRFFFLVRIGSRGKRGMHVHPWNVEERL